jgi:chromosome segregation ATPase
MADQKLRILIETAFKDKGMNQAKKSLKDFGNQATKNQKAFESAKKTFQSMVFPIAAVGGAVFAAKKAFDFAKEGAQLETVRDTFDSLAKSVNSTSEAMLVGLRAATEGMVSDTDLMMSANRFLAMGLAATADEAAELSRVAVSLGAAMGKDATAAMEEFALLMANQSIPRLDTFGISAGKVRTRIKELMAANEGLTREGAFNQAVMEEAAISMDKLGNAVPIDPFTQLEVAAKNTTDELKILMSEGLGPLAGQMAGVGIPIKQAERALKDLGLKTKDIRELRSEVAKLDKGLTNTEREARVMAKVTEILEAGFEGTAEEVVSLARAADNANHPIHGLVRNMQEGADEADRLSDHSEILNDKLAMQAARMSDATVETRRHQLELKEAAILEEELARVTEERAALSLAAFKTALEDTNEPLQFFNQKLSELGPTAQEATVNEDALTQSLFDQVSALVEDETQLALMAGALGLYNEEQLAAALQTAALTAKVSELGAQVAAGQITITEAQTSLIDYANRLGETEAAAIGAAGAIDETHKEAVLLRDDGPYDATAEVKVKGLASLRNAVSLMNKIRSAGPVNVSAGQGGLRAAARQHGGPVQAGRPFLVGEAGAELFVPNANGRIVPNNSLNMGGVTVNVTAGSGNPAMIGSEVGKAIKDMVLGQGMRG